MKVRLRKIRAAWLILAMIWVLGLGASLAAAKPRPQQTEPVKPKKLISKTEALAEALGNSPMDPQEMESTRRTFIEILERYPRLNNVISRDPSLLSNQEYITSAAPGLWEFLQKHPEIQRDPEFFMAGRLRREAFIERDTAPDPATMRFLNDAWPFMVFVIIMASLLWTVRLITENRRWSRLAKVQADAHNKLLERFGSSQEILAYMATEPGKRFLESAPIPIDFEPQTRFSAPLGRILLSAQMGLVLALGGVGLLYIRGSVPAAEEPLLVFGTLGLTLGIGFIFSAAISYGLSRHLGLFEGTENSSPIRAESGSRVDRIS
jgi:hypothetical protein